MGASSPLVISGGSSSGGFLATFLPSILGRA